MSKRPYSKNMRGALTIGKPPTYWRKNMEPPP